MNTLLFISIVIIGAVLMTAIAGGILYLFMPKRTQKIKAND